MTARVIAIEGSDGVGKATQTKKLIEHLRRDGFRVATISFPRYDTPTGKRIKKYLEGELGDPKNIDPIESAHLYHNDRKAALPLISNMIKENDFLILDRYKYSSFAHQPAKLKEPEKMISLMKDIEQMENDIPEANLVIFLHVTPEISQTLIKKEKKCDIFESDIEYLGRTNELYQELVKRDNWKKIECMKNGKLLSVEEIHDKVYKEALS